ncbi:trithorax group protein osa isoform X2 [Drosophila obscura]|uniref:trithorax group protein osa isoform X2 n=1 Tax=Drosophila obscura TaxID=7282 RepID=UPI001BB104BD|nr:trithorax group protein osa isoform X2 [Drosophila obscura]
MSDRYQAGYYDHHQHSHSHHPHPYPHQTAMSHYPPQPYRSGYSGYHPYAGGYGYGSASSSYMPNYYRYAAYASPHYSQPHAHPHQGMFTPAGQQLIPSSVLHYPPRSHPQAHPYQHQPQQQQQQSSYEQPPPSLYSSSASSSAYGQARGFGGYPGPTPHYAPPGRSTTPAPNRTVLPPNYLEPIRGYPEQHQLQHQHQHQQLPLSATPKLEESMPAELEVEAGSPAQRLTTSPPLISATGTDSGISNCSTRARSDSSQSTPVYSGEYPVNMSVESASCVPYHCPAEYEEEEQPQQQPPQQQPPQQQQQQQQSSVESEPELEERKVASVREAQTSSTPLDIPDDISATAAQSASPPTPPVASIDKATPTPTAAAVSEVPRRMEINLAKPNKETAAVAAAAAAGAEAQADTAAERATPTPQDAVERGSPSNPISEDAAEMPELGQEHPLPPATASNIWSTSPRRSRTPPVPQNSPVGYGQSASVPPGLAPLFQQQQKQSPSSHKRQTTAAKSRSISISNSNRIMECDLIPSKKSKRRTSKREAGGEEQLESMEPTVREQIRDIKPLPGFLQAFGSTEIGRFSERFLQTPESLVERLAEEYAASNSSFSPYTTGGYYEPPSAPPHSYHPYEEQQHAGYQGHMHMAHARNRGMRGHGGYGYEMPDYMAYERYAAYGAGRPRHRYGEIRCNGY